MGKVSGTIFLLDQERIARILHVRRPHAHRPLQFCHIGAKIHDGAALVHIDTGAHIGITVPEHLLFAAVEDIPPERALRLPIGFFLPVILREFAHGHIRELSFFFQLPIVGAAVLIRFFQKFKGSFPAPHFIHPRRSHKHHIVSVAVVELCLIAELIDQVVQIRVLPALINHAPQHILRMSSEVGAISVIAGNQIPGEMRYRDDPRILRLIHRRRMSILF